MPSVFNLNILFAVSFLGSLLALITFGLFYDFGAGDLLWQEIKNTGHTMVFILLSFSARQLLWIYRPQWSRLSLAITIIFCLLLGLAIELLQGFTFRNPSVEDFLRDLAGTFIGVLLFWVYRHRTSSTPHSKTAMAIVACLILFVSAFGHVGMLSLHTYQRYMALPELLDFDKPWHNTFFQSHSAEVTRPESKGVLVKTKLATYPGVSVLPTPDWRGYDRLIIDIESFETETFPIVLRVHDSAHNHAYRDRFNRRFVLLPGVNHLVVDLQDVRTAPSRRYINLGEISNVALFIYKPKKTRLFGITSIRLEEN